MDVNSIKQTKQVYFHLKIDAQSQSSSLKNIKYISNISHDKIVCLQAKEHFCILRTVFVVYSWKRDEEHDVTGQKRKNINFININLNWN